MNQSDPVTKFTSDLSITGLCRSILDARADRRSKPAERSVMSFQRIMQAVLELSSEKGFHAMSMRDIGKRSGMSLGGLYAYFDQKEDLALMILEAVITTLRRELTVPDALEHAPERIAWLIRRHIHTTDEMRPWFQFAYLEAKAFPAAARQRAIQIEADIEELFAAELRRGVAQGTLACDTPQMHAAILKPMMQDWYVKRSKWLHRGLSAAQYGDFIVEFFMDRLRVADAAS